MVPMPSLKPTVQKGEHYSKDDVCFLMYSTIRKDDLHQQIEVLMPGLVYCATSSIGTREFSSTMQSGLKAEYVFIIDYDEYDGEKVVEYNRILYTVYRTFVRSDGDIELYCEKRVGA